MTTDFEIYWDRCIRELGASAMEPKLVAKWCFDKAQPTLPARPSARCIEGNPHTWLVLEDRPGWARCPFCKIEVNMEATP